MRKYLLWLSVAVLTGYTVLQSLRKELSSEEPVNKSLSFAVYSDNTYSANVYNDVMAQPRIIINKLSANTKTVVWDKTYDLRQLRYYSSLENGMLEKVVIKNIMESKDELEITCILTYNTKGSVLKMYNDTILTAREKNGKVLITL